jgi:type II secretory pathway component PulF
MNAESSSSPQVPSLDAPSLAILLEEVSAMTAARRSLLSGLTLFSDMSLGKIGRAAKFVCAKLDQGYGPADSIAPLSTEYGATIRTAFDVVSRTGSNEAIDQIVNTIHEEEQSKRDLRIAIVNPLITVLLAGAILYWVIPQILAVDAAGQRMKDGLERSVPAILDKFESDYWWWIGAVAVGLGLLGGLMYWAIVRLQRRTLELANQASFCRWMAFMVGSSSDLSTSIEAASSVVGPKHAKSWSDSARQVRGGAQSIESLHIPGDVPADVGQCIADLASHQRPADEVAVDLKALSQLYHQRSMSRRRLGIEVVPRLISSVVAVLAILLIVKTAIRPLLDAVEQVAR